MRARLRAVALRWRRLSARFKLGAAVAVIALAGLVWQHYSYRPGDQITTAAEMIADESGQHADHHEHNDGHAYGEYQPAPGELADNNVAPALDMNPEAARATVERFAVSFASPAGGAAEWLAGIAPDITPALQDQYRLTDIRVVPATTVTAVTGPLTEDMLSPTFRVDYADGTAVEITTEMGVDGWKVSVVVPVEAAPIDIAVPAENAATIQSTTTAASVPPGAGRP